MHAWQARFTQSISPPALRVALADWASHLANAPGRQAELAQEAAQMLARLILYALAKRADSDATPAAKPSVTDRRFSDPGWREPPFDILQQSFLLTQQWWHDATTGVRGVAPADERIAEFVARQVLDLLSPSNNPLINPEVLRATLVQGGQNLLRGLANMAEDCERLLAGDPPVGAERFRVGHEVAASPGMVVYRDDLMELIQYAPATAAVRPEPVLIVPAWIMKYYILDLSPGNSLVGRLVAEGFTVFMISWRNPEAEDRNFGLEDYRKLGIDAALAAIAKICPEVRVHACGYCLGGTLLSIAAARMARDGEDRLASITLLAAETDFGEAGELMLFVNESEVSYLEDIMWARGYLDAGQMSGAFQILRSNDLIWSQMVRQYLLGERRPMTDLMAWNADTTRMPYRMHSEYLRDLFLHNDLAEGRYQADGKALALSGIRTPIFVLGTETDHVAPWQSVYKIHLLTNAHVTFVLTTGGHNVGVLALPERREGLPARAYRMGERIAGAPYVDAKVWRAGTQPHEGSWWPAWFAWLGRHSANPVPPPAMGARDAGLPVLAKAPGRYVLEH